MSNTSAPQFFVPMTAQSEDLAGSGGGSIDILSGDNENANIDFLGKKFIDSKAEGIILPAVDFNISPADSQFPLGTSGVRMDPPQLDSDVDKKHHALSHFMLPVDMFDFINPTKDTILSPAFLQRLGISPKAPEAQCPWKDIFFACNRKFKDGQMDEKTYERYTKGVSQQEKAIIPQRRTYYAVNTWYKSTKEQQGRSSILLMGTVAFRQMRAAINEQFPSTLMAAGVKPRDPQHPAYFFGDITNRGSAVMWEVVKRKIENVAQESNVLDFGGWGQGATGIPELSYDHIKTMAVTDEMLAARKVLHCRDYWNVKTPQEIVDYTLEKLTNIPYDWVVEACSGYAEVSPNGNTAQFATGAAPAGVATPAPSSGSFAAPSAPAVPGAPAAAPARSFWVALPGVTPVKHNEAEASALAQDPATLFMDVTDTSGVWKSAAEAGIVVPPPVPAAPATPAVPAAPATPETQIPMPAPANTAQADDIPDAYESSDKLTDEENRDLARIEADYKSAVATGTQMNPRDVERRAELLSKKNG